MVSSSTKLEIQDVKRLLERITPLQTLPLSDRVVQLFNNQSLLPVSDVLEQALLLQSCIHEIRVVVVILENLTACPSTSHFLHLYLESTFSP